MKNLWLHHISYVICQTHFISRLSMQLGHKLSRHWCLICRALTEVVIIIRNNMTWAACSKIGHHRLGVQRLVLICTDSHLSSSSRDASRFAHWPPSFSNANWACCVVTARSDVASTTWDMLHLLLPQHHLAHITHTSCQNLIQHSNCYACTNPCKFMHSAHPTPRSILHSK